MIKTLTKKAALVLLLFIPLTQMAQTVVISEVGFRSSASSDDYVELYNTTGSAINLNNYTLVPSVGSTVTITGTIPANGFFIIAKNTAQASFESSWGVTLGASVGYYNSGNVLSTTSGVTFTLNDASATALDNTTGYGITPGTRLYQCPVGSFLGNNQSNTSISDCNPGSVESLSVDDLTHWTVSIYNNTWDVPRINHVTPTENLIIKNEAWTPAPSDLVNDVYISNSSYINITTSAVTVGGNLYINDNGSVRITSTGSLSVTGTVYHTMTGENTNNKYNVWSTPFSSTTDILGTFTGVNPCDVYTFQATTQEWKSDYSVPFSTTCNGNSVTFQSANVISSPEGTPDGNMDVGRGYFIPGDASNTTRTLSGSSLNNGNINVSVYGSSVSVAGGNDWNIVGNPYPGGLWINQFLQNANNASLINAVYIYNGNSGAYETYNPTSGFVISSCQGFFINAVSTTDGLLGSLNFTNSMRSRYSTTFRNSNQTIYISMTAPQFSDNIQIVLDPNSSDGLDPVHDAFKLPNPNNFNLATYIDTELFVFNGIKPIEENQTKTVRVYVQTPDAGNYEINIDSLNMIGANIDVVLEDKVNGSFTNLKNSNYAFSTAQSETFDNRFFLHLTNNVTSVSELTNELNVSIYTTDGFVNVNALGKTNIDKVEIYDVLGKITYLSNKSNNSHIINVEEYQSGVYFVKAYGENGKLSTKRIYISN